MITAIREWMTAVVTVTMLLSVAQSLIPEGSIRKIASLTCGLILLLVLLQPVLQTDLSNLQINMDDYAAAIQERQTELQAVEQTERTTLIAGKTQAYILDKAKELGLDVEVHVTTALGEDGVAYPDTVDVDGAWSSELANVIEQDLGIPQERQVWHEQN